MSAQLQPTTVRLSVDLADRLHALSERSGVDEATLMRRAIEEKVGQWEHDGKIEITLRDKPLTEAQRAALAAAESASGDVSYPRARSKRSVSSPPVIGGNLGKALEEHERGSGSEKGRSEQGGSSHRQ